ncbi:MAG TPA: hypothetical protein VM243_20110 [Phycisphaerae bacterium]|nr:hypothetical protein [Phycisphaerae bacterium]
MPTEDELEVLQAVLALAAADGNITRSEKGVYEQLAGRIGADAMTIWRMMNEVRINPSARDKLFQKGARDPQAAMKLLVATARIDGDISQEERELLVDISGKLGIGVDEFGKIYTEAIATADAMRKRRGG